MMTVDIVIQKLQKTKEGKTMKRFIALGAALFVLLFSFAANVTVERAENDGIQVCSDLKPDPNPYDEMFSKPE